MEKDITPSQPEEPASDQLTARQEKLLSFLAGNPNITAAAKAAGVGRATVHRWLQEPSFREELTRRRNMALTEAMNSVQAYTAQAVEELIKLLNSPNEWLRRQICMDILNCSQKTMATEQIFQRLDALEKDRETKQNGRK